MGDPDFIVRTRREDGVIVVEILDALDLATVRELGPYLDEVERADEPVVIDLCKCDFVGSIGLALLIRLRLRLLKQHRSLTIVCPPTAAPARLFNLAANGMFDLFGSRSEALEHLHRRLA